ncbi:hypothetical protein MGL_1930 [Malassezia globosa CBS 7966]|uniref:Eukaryotic translation initiation factor 3 subunit K n=1 Tax=Malassezia globosa (strain ATCC MYA-4612 / CBS 7966) TaxID=425265 RepID=A8PZL8_MALGO|nr:uncharacterized protein MGL_1930 [Malassezia globosa CBS 7966]EDP43717.1 hypothetical protein MGL_1930 [Malassezia globosa CBS 7966]
MPDRYSPQSRDILLQYLENQLENGTNDILANLAILKLFQLNPSDFSLDTAVLILIKALTATPFPDFHLCISLLGEAPVRTLSIHDTTQASTGKITEPIIVRLSTLSELLFQTKFVQFWNLYSSDEYKDVRSYTSKVAHFEDDIRKVALYSVKGAFRTISESRLSGYLHLEGEALARFIENQREEGWSLANGTVAVPPNPDNEVKSTVVREEVSLERCRRRI